MSRTRKYNIQIWKPEKKIYEVEQIEEDAKDKIVALLRFLSIPYTVSWLRETSKSKKSLMQEENTKTISGLHIRKPRKSESTPTDFTQPHLVKETE